MPRSPGTPADAAHLGSVSPDPVEHTVLEKYVDDYGNPGYCLLVGRSLTKPEVVGLCEHYLLHHEQNSTLLVHLYASLEAFNYRNDLSSPHERYFKHLIAQCYRHPRFAHDEIRYFPDAQVLLYGKAAA